MLQRRRIKLITIRYCPVRHILLNLLTSLMITGAPTNIPRSINSFGNKVYDVLPDKRENIVFSPISAHVALSLTYQGAAGETAESFRNSLGVPEASVNAEECKNFMSNLNAVRNVTIHLANKIYVKNGYRLKDNFKVIAKTYFSADGQNIEFSRKAEAAAEINRWVKLKTDNKIDKLISSTDLDANTRVVLLNVIYFKGNWIAKFRKRDTRRETFHTGETKFVDCQMMHQTNYFDYAENGELDAKILKMKYEDERFSMIVVLPNSGNDIEELERKLARKDISSLTKTNAMSYKQVVVSIPKFKFESTLQLNPTLRKIGLGKMFSDAQFPNMIDTDETLQIDKVVQKAFIEIDEKGSKAAASTGVIVALYSEANRPPSPQIFKADHPFVFYITARFGNGVENILLMGRIRSPPQITNG